MKPAPFIYRRPTSRAAALELLAEHGPDAKVLAGGQSLIPLLNFRLSRPAMIVDLGNVGDDREPAITDDGSLRVGALTRQSALGRFATSRPEWRLLATAISHIGHVQIRNRGTVGGSIAHADPAAELPAVGLACGGRVLAASRDGERSIPFDELFVGPFMTTLRPDELLVEVEIGPVDRGAFAEVARRHGDFALGGVVLVRRGGELRIVAFGLGWTPVRLAAAEAIANGSPRTPHLVSDIVGEATREIEPLDDIHADAATRREIVGALLERTLPEVLA